jgi:glycosyltransferase involved in cell wall biosynthesis
MVRVSVVIPTFNRENYIGRAIESVLNQTYSDYEIIVIDDGSTDQTKQKVLEYGDSIHYIYQENQGPSAARNKGIQLAQGEYIAFLDSDDCFLPQKLERQLAFIDKHPDCKFQYSWYNHIKVGKKIEKVRTPWICKDLEHLQYALYKRQFTIRTSTVLVAKECFTNELLFNNKYLYSQDWDMWLRLANYYYGYCIEEPLAEYYSDHGDNRSSRKVNIYHQEIKDSILELYGWDDHNLKLLEDKYNF